VKIMSKPVKRSALWVGICICLISGAAMAVIPSGEVFRSTTPQTFTGGCCFSWFETVKVSEPATPVPVVVTWSVDYQGSSGEEVGLSVNSGPCISYGASSLYFSFDSEPPGAVQSRTFNWIVTPTDAFGSPVLHRGTNTFTLCGGGRFTAQQSIIILNNTLTARISQ
jgi:hypothetical protein